MTKKFLLRLEESVFDQLKSQAAKHATSLNSYCVSLIKQSSGFFKEEAQSVFLEKIKKTFGRNLQGVVLFGSVARGTETKSSDVDLMIVLDSSVPLKGRLYREWDEKMEEFLGPNLSPHFVHLPQDLAQSGSLLLEVALEGKILFDKDKAVESFLRELRKRIAEGHFVRSYSYGVPYWKRGA